MLSVNENRLAAFSIIWKAFLFVGVFFCLLCICSSCASNPSSPSQVTRCFQWRISWSRTQLSLCSTQPCFRAMNVNPQPSYGTPPFLLPSNQLGSIKEARKVCGMTTRAFLGTRVFASSWHVIWGWRRELQDAFQVMRFKTVLLKDHRPQGMQSKFLSSQGYSWNLQHCQVASTL